MSNQTCFVSARKKGELCTGGPQVLLQRGQSVGHRFLHVARDVLEEAASALHFALHARLDELRHVAHHALHVR